MAVKPQRRATDGATAVESAAVAPLLAGLPPIIDSGVETLILGSFPSPASLAAGSYYAHPQNQFWRLLAAVLDEPQLPGADMAERRRLLLMRGVGVWDLYRHCRREGALDAAIEDPELNDFAALRRAAPRLGSAVFNGLEAARSARRLALLGLHTAVVPSTSPAYTLPFARKLERWRALWPSALGESFSAGDSPATGRRA